MLKEKDKNINLNQILNYILIGVLTTIVSLATYYGLVFTVLSPQNPVQLQVANIISWIVGVTFAYVGNRMVVFKSYSSNIWKEIGEFCLARIGTLVLEAIGMFIMVTLLKMNDKVVKIIVSFGTVIVNYLLGKLWVFR